VTYDQLLSGLILGHRSYCSSKDKIRGRKGFYGGRSCSDPRLDLGHHGRAGHPAAYPGANLTDPDSDLDGDGLTNEEARVWWVDPTSGVSSSPIVFSLGSATRMSSCQRHNPGFSGAAFSFEDSTTLGVNASSGDSADWSSGCLKEAAFPV
jgi:hypothetical protein